MNLWARGAVGKELVMHDKSRPAHEAKKPGKTLKQKKAEKRGAHAQAPTSIIPPRKPSNALPH